MEFFQIQMYLKEVVIQCENVEYAYEQLQVNIAIGEENNRKVFFYIQAFLNHSAIISKIIWGSADRKDLREFRQVRTSVIQEIFQIKASSPIHLKFMISNFENFDKNLDAWANDPNTFNNLIDHDLGTTYPMSTVSGSSAKRFFRNYDPETQEANFFGQYLDLGAIKIEVARIESLAASKIEEFGNLNDNEILSKLKKLD